MVNSSVPVNPAKVRLSEHFTLAEFQQTEHRRIANTIPPSLMDEAKAMAQFAEGLRAYLSKLAGKDIPIHPSSVYRCLQLNRAIGSEDTSDHVLLMAMDFTAPAFGTPYEVAKALAKAVDELGIGQLIYEQTWIHASRKPVKKLINRIITKKSPDDYLAGIVEV